MKVFAEGLYPVVRHSGLHKKEHSAVYQGNERDSEKCDNKILNRSYHGVPRPHIIIEA